MSVGGQAVHFCLDIHAFYLTVLFFPTKWPLLRRANFFFCHTKVFWPSETVITRQNVSIFTYAPCGSEAVSVSVRMMLCESSSFRYPTAVVAAIAAATTAIIATWTCFRLQKEHETRIAKLDESRLAERTGRVRAEIKLRTHLKNQEARYVSPNNASESDGGNIRDAEQGRHNLLLQCIGTIVSPYTKRMGTPRQGALVPSGRGYIQLKIPVECVEGLDCYSHAWVLFTFHANTDIPHAKINQNGSMMKLSKTKIRPPRGNGLKVGMLATRSPHRPNNIGLSLVRIARVERKTKQVHIVAFDLVNGTPVFDIKPFVPWDMPGYHDKVLLSVPNWVSKDDELKSVEFSSRARKGLEKCIRDENALAPFYTCGNDGITNATNAIREILAQDPRASNSNRGNKRGSSSAHMRENDTYKILFGLAEIEFQVGCDGVVVENVRSGLDLNRAEYVDGIPVLLEKS